MIPDNNIEIWKPILEFPNYEISNHCRIRSLGRFVECAFGKRKWNKEKILKPSINGSGYYMLSLYENKKPKNVLIHTILGKYFIENTNNKPFLNHKNGIKTDNRIDNLEWVTAKENVIHAIQTGLHKSPAGKDHYSAKSIINKITGEIYITIKDAARHSGISAGALKSRLRRNHKTFQYV